MSSDKMSQAAEILRVLLIELPDEILQKHFQDLSPEQVQKILQEAIDFLAPETDEQPMAPSQTPLWQDKEKTWKGKKLAGRTLQLFSDGASRGNPGEAGAGIAILLSLLRSKPK